MTNSNFLPASTGLTLGNQNQRWSTFLDNLDTSLVSSDLIPVNPGQNLGSPSNPWNADLDTVTAGQITASGDILPTTTGTQNLGSLTEQWNAFLANASFTSATSPLINNVVYVDGITYPFTDAGIQAAINAACNGTIPGKVVLGPVPAGTAIPINTTINVPSNCWIDGPGAKNLTLQAAGVTSEIFQVSGSSNVFLSNFGIDGARIGSGIFGIGIYSCTNVHVYLMSIGNCFNNGILITNGGYGVYIHDCEVFNSGRPLPTSGGSGIGIGGGNSSANISHVQIVNCAVHGNNIGIDVIPSSNSASVIEGLLISECQVYANCNDGISLFTSDPTFGSILAPQIVNNESFSNGWPANGTGFSTNTPPGLLQAGANDSTSGCGIDVLGVHGLIQQATILGNYCHDNVFDGIAFDSHMIATVDTSGTAVTATSGVFSLDWKTGAYVKIGGSYYPVASVATTTSLTLGTSAGTLTGQQLLGPTKTYAIVTGNQCKHNGLGQSGTGFFQTFCSYSTFSDNVALQNNQEGFGLDGCYCISFKGDTAFGNNLSGNAGHKFGFALKQGCTNITMRDVIADDVATSPTQLYGVGVAQTSANVCSGTVIDSSAVFGSTAPVIDSGTNTFYKDLGGVASLTGKTAAILATTLYTPVVTGLFRISAYLKVTTTGTSPVIGPVTITYTDGADSVAQSVIMSMQTEAGVAQATGNSGNATTTVLSGELLIYAELGVAIQYAIALTGTVGAAAYEAQLKCKAV